MPNGTPLRSDCASQTAELRPVTPMIALATLLGKADDLYETADRELTKRKLASFKVAHDATYKALCASQIALLDLIPQGDDRDLMILAGFASMLADQLPDVIPDGETSAYNLAKGISTALTAISATLANRWSAGVDSVELIYPELAASIRRDVRINEARRADAEGR